MRGAGLVALALVLAGCASTDPQRSPGGSHSSSTSPATTSPSTRSSPTVPRTTTPAAVPASGGCQKSPLPGRGMLAFDFNPTTDINSEQANAPGDVFTV